MVSKIYKYANVHIVSKLCQVSLKFYEQFRSKYVYKILHSKIPESIVISLEMEHALFADYAGGTKIDKETNKPVTEGQRSARTLSNELLPHPLSPVMRTLVFISTLNFKSVK